MMMEAQYHSRLDTLLGCFQYCPLAMTLSNTSSGSGRAPRGIFPGRHDRAYVHPAAPSDGIRGFYTMLVPTLPELQHSQISNTP